MPKINDLVDLSLTEVSLVDRPANAGAEVVLFKRDAAQPQEEVPMSEQTETVVKTEVAPDLSAIEALIAKSETRLDELNTALNDKNAVIKKMQAELDTLRTENLVLTTQAETVAKRDTSNDTLDDILKSAPEPIQKALATLTERVEKAESSAKRYADQIEKSEWVKKAEPLANHLPATADAIGGLLQRVAKGMSTADDAAELERIFKSVNAMAGQHGTLFQEIGNAAGDTVTAKSRIEAVATDIRKSETGLSQEQAVAKALAQHPDLYVDYLTEHRATATA